MVRMGDKVALDGKLVRWEQLNVVTPSRGVQEQFTYIKYWKPRGVVCTTDQAIKGNVVDAVRLDGISAQTKK